MIDRVGQQFGNYRLTRLLGRGGFAEVYLGLHLYLETQAAIKVLHTQLSPDESERFRMEARTVARLEHPHIVRILEFGVEGHLPFLAMSYAPHGSLRDRYPKGTCVPLHEVVLFVKQIAAALQYAHDAQLIHRDLKPENLLVGRNQEVLLSDFGLVLVLQQSGSLTTQDMAGTIPYAAPEQLQGHPCQASDQYSLGIAVYEWLCGVRPFQGSALAIITQHLHALPPSLRGKNSSIPAAVEEVVLTALSKDPRERFARVSAFATALQQACPPDEARSSQRQGTFPAKDHAALDERGQTWRDQNGADSRTDQNGTIAEVSTDRKMVPDDEHRGMSRTPTQLPEAREQLTAMERVPKNNLPVPLTPLIGREQEIAAVCRLLQRADVRLVTLTGVGGIGKTRLAIQIAATLLETFADGICFVSLASLNDPELVLPAIAHTLGLREAGDWPLLERLQDHLREKQMLVLLDNFEQVVSAGVRLVDLLAACPRLKILVTSRAILHVRGEYEFPVPPLALPDPLRLSEESDDLLQYSAVALFMQRTQAMKPDFQLTVDNARVIADICQRLDGLPLAIELAAARIKLLPPHALLSRLDHRLDVLTHAPSDLPARHHSLRRTLAWSYDLLTAEEQQLFRRLSVFVGGCTLEAAESVYKAFGERTDALAFSVLDGVTSLLDKSLLHQKGQEEPRLVLLETIREYGQECLLSCGEAPLAHRAHADYYLALAQRAESKLMGIEQKSWFERLEQEYENLWMALEWLEEQNEIEKALQFGAALWRFWWARGYLNQGSTTLERLLRAAEGVSTPVRAKALTVIGLLIDAQGDAGRAEELCKESLRLFRGLGDVQGISTSLVILGSAATIRSDYAAARALLEEGLALGRRVRDPMAVTSALAILAHVAIEQGEYVEARSLIEESLKLARQASDTWGIARALFLLATVLFLAHGDHAGADRLLEEGLILSRTVGDKRGIAYASLWLGLTLFFQGRYPSARSLMEESLHLLMEAGDRRGIALGLYGLAGLTLMQGDPVEARTLYEESIALLRKINYSSFIPSCLEGLARAILAQGDPAWAARLWGKAESIREVIEVPTPVLMHTLYKQAVATARAQLGEETFATMWRKGRMMTLEQVLAQTP